MLLSMLPHTLAAQIGTGVWLVGCMFALWRGGQTERQAAAVLLADVAALHLLPWLNPLGSVRWWTASTDLATLFGLAWIARRSSRAWLRAALGFQFLAVLVHAPKLLDPTIRSWGYITVATSCGYAVILALVVGSLTRPPPDPHAH